VERIAFETADPDDPDISGEMTITTELEPAEGGTLVTMSLDRLPWSSNRTALRPDFVQVSNKFGKVGLVDPVPFTETRVSRRRSACLRNISVELGSAAQILQERR